MIKNFKWLLLLSLAITACSSDDDENGTVDEPITAGSADFSKYVALGDSFAAGYSDGALFKAGQENAYPNILAQQFSLAGGGAFTTPFVNDNIGGFSVGGNQVPQFLQRLIITGIVDGLPVITPFPATTTTDLTEHLTGPFNNMGVPGANSFHLGIEGYGSLNPYFGRFASGPNASIIGDALAQNPTFFSLWIGGNDVLSYATNGGDPSGGNAITPVDIFDTVYMGLAAQLSEGGREGVVANLPYINTLPFFTAVPYDPLTASALGGGNVAVGDATIDALNTQLYGPLKQALTAFGAGDRINLLSHTGGNPLLIRDETLENLSAQLTAAFTPTLGAQAAAFYGQVFGQARQTKGAASGAQDLVPLKTKTIIGTAPVGIPAPLDKYGITYPLDDKHILIPSEIQEIAVATDAYNITIANAATANNLAFVDAKAIMNQLLNGGIRFGNYHMSAAFVTGGMFSLDGIHPSARGYALIANKFLEAINAKYGSNFKGVDPADYQIQYPAQL
jgi:lysophospholipase L1-like esterase